MRRQDGRRTEVAATREDKANPTMFTAWIAFGIVQTHPEELHPYGRPRAMVRRHSQSLVKELGPDVLAVQRGGGRPLRGLFGVTLAVAMVIGFIVAPRIPFIDDVVGWRFLLGVSAPMALLLGVFQFVHSRVWIDRAAKLVYEWGKLGPFGYKRRLRFDEFNCVKIERIVMRARSATSIHFSTMLIGPEPHVPLLSGNSYRSMRRHAERIGAFMQLPLRDAAVETTYREDGSVIEERPPEALRGSLRQQAAGTAATTFPSKPPECRIGIRREAGRIVFDLPTVHRRLFPAFGVVALAMGAAGGLAVGVMHFTEPDDPVAIRAFLWCFPAFVGTIVPIVTVWNGLDRRRQNESVAVSQSILSHHRRGVFSSRNFSVPVDEIEQLGYTKQAAAWGKAVDAGHIVSTRAMPSAAINLRSDYGRVQLGHNLRRAEQVWLHDALNYLLSTPTPDKRN